MKIKVLAILFVIACFTKSFPQSTASVQVSTFQIEAPQLDTIKTIWIYTPKNYSEEKQYPVIYMHDAQNLFDHKTSYVGEWGVDEFLDSIQQPEVIIVGIEHGNEKRIDELTPFPNAKYGGGKGDAYLDFIRFTLKPHIDASYSTKPEADNTYIIGSSLGGLISYYAVLKYPEVFGNAGVFSPSFWFSQMIYDFTGSSEIKRDTRFYFMAGDKESEEMVPDMKKMVELLKEKGVSEDQIQVKVRENGEHNEASWKAEFPEAFSWLLRK